MGGVVYMYTCKTNGKRYIGQTWDIVERRRSHRRAKGDVRLFHRAIHKYGYDNFDFEILQDNIETQELLDAFEFAATVLYNTLAPYGYNMMLGGDGHTKEMRTIASEKAKERFSRQEERQRMSEKIKAFHSDPKKERLQNERIRKAWDENPEYRRRVYEAAKRRKTDPVWLEKNKERAKRRATPIVCIETGVLYYGIAEAARKTGLPQTSLCRHVANGSGSCRGTHWRFATKEEAISVRS